jgi:hypothetical protein
VTPAAPANTDLLGVPQSTWNLLFGAVAAFAVAVVHGRGTSLPIISSILNALGDLQAQPAPALPAIPASQPALGHGLILQMIQQTVAAELQNLLAAPPAAPAKPAAS